MPLLTENVLNKIYADSREQRDVSYITNNQNIDL